MKRFQFTTHVELTEENEDKFWITDDCPTLEIEAETIKEAITEWAALLREEYTGYIIDDPEDFCLYSTDKKQGLAFNGKTLIVDRGADFCGEVDVYIYTEICEIKTKRVWQEIEVLEDVDLEVIA